MSGSASYPPFGGGGGGGSGISAAAVEILIDKYARYARTLVGLGGNSVVDLGAFWPTPAFITDATNASPIVVTTSGAHGFITGQAVRVKNVAGNTAANGTWVIAVLSSTTFSLTGSTGSGAYVAGGAASFDTDPCVHPMLSTYFWWEAWVRPDATNQGYWLSDSGGGAHALLIGFQGSVPGSPVDGNLSGSTSGGNRSDVSFGGHSAIGANEWAHVAVGCDGSNIRVYVNGVLSGKKSLGGMNERWGLTTTGGGHPMLFGPVDHQTWIGAIAQARCWDPIITTTALPSAPASKVNFLDPTANKLELAFRPERVFSPGVGDLSNTYLSADGLWRPAADGSVVDYSDFGKAGAKHNGTPKNTASVNFALNGRAAYRDAAFDTMVHAEYDRTCPCKLEPLALVTAATATSPIAITCSRNHGRVTGDVVVIDSVAGLTGANGTWVCTVTGDTTLTLDGSVGGGAYTSGGNVNVGAVEQSRTPLTTPSQAIVWDSVQRRNQTYAYQPASIITMGSTEAGSAGVKAWATGRNPFFGGMTAGYAAYGILDGAFVFLGDSDGYYGYVDSGVSNNYELYIDGESGTYGIGSAALIFRMVDGNNFRIAIWDRTAQSLVVAQVSGGSYVGPDAGAVSVTSIAAISGTSYKVRVVGTQFDFYAGTSQASLIAGGGTLIRTHTGQTTNQTGTKVGIYHEADSSLHSSGWRYKKFLMRSYP